MLRAIAKTSVATGIHWTGLDRLVGSHRGMRDLPLVVCYHRVVSNFEKSALHSIAPMLASTATFERHLDWIGRRYEFVSLDELADIQEGIRTAKKPVAAVTFDDGYADVYRHAFPILKRKGIPSAAFVVTDLVGTPRLQIHDELYLLLSTAVTQWQPRERRCLQEFNESLNMDPVTSTRLCNYARDPAVLNDSFRVTRAFLEILSQSEIEHIIKVLRNQLSIDEEAVDGLLSLNWDMIREMAANGVTVGSHTKSHALLVNESRETVMEEILGSRKILEEQLAGPVHHFAYPDGRFDRTAVEGVAKAGFRSAYTICMHRDEVHPMLTVPRRVLWENTCMNGFGRFSPSIMSCLVNGIFEPALRCQQNHIA